MTFNERKRKISVCKKWISQIRDKGPVIRDYQIAELITKRAKIDITKIDISRIIRGHLQLISVKKLNIIEKHLGEIQALSKEELIIELEQLTALTPISLPLQKSNSRIADVGILGQGSIARFYSYNLFDDGNKCFKNYWEFSNKKSGISVIRIGGNKHKFSGDAHFSQKHIYLNLTNFTDGGEIRSYIGEYDESMFNVEPTKVIKLLGLGLNGIQNPTAGREILIFEANNKPKKSEARALSFAEVQLLDKKILNFLYDEESTYSLHPKPTTLEQRFSGLYLVYFISSFTDEIVRNRLSIQIKDGRAEISFETDIKNLYKVIMSHYHDEKLFILFKDLKQNSYFSFHFKTLSQNQNPNFEYLAGSYSSIGMSSKRPISSVILLKRVAKEEYKKTSLGRIEEKSYNDEEVSIRTYFELIASNPIKIKPLHNIKNWNEEVNIPLKEKYFNSIRKAVQSHMHPSLRVTHQDFIDDIIEIIHQFTSNSKVTLQSRYLEMFRIFHENLLEEYKEKECNFYATSYPSPTYFWRKNNTTNEYMQRFVDNKGKIHRIFYIRSDNDLPIHSEFNIIQEHFNIYGEKNKGTVYVTNISKLPIRLKSQYEDAFSTEDYSFISWKVSTKGLARKIDEQEIYFDKETHKLLLEKFKVLVSNKKATKKVTFALIENWKRKI